MKYHIDCEHCGHQLTAYMQVMNKGMVDALGKLVGYWFDNRKRANLQRDIGVKLTKTQYCTFQKLQYWGLVHRNTEGWLPTDLGIEFREGRATIKDRVATLGRKILDYDHDAWKTTKSVPKDMYVWDFDKIYNYKQRSEYVIEKSKREALFPDQS